MSPQTAPRYSSHAGFQANSHVSFFDYDLNKAISEKNTHAAAAILSGAASVAFITGGIVTYTQEPATPANPNPPVQNLNDFAVSGGLILCGTLLGCKALRIVKDFFSSKKDIAILRHQRDRDLHDRNLRVAKRSDNTSYGTRQIG